jgi:hypothetical protein
VAAHVGWDLDSPWPSTIWIQRTRVSRSWRATSEVGDSVGIGALLAVLGFL